MEFRMSDKSVGSVGVILQEIPWKGVIERSSSTDEISQLGFFKM